MTDRNNAHDLPPEILPYVEIIGLEATVVLIRQWGGTRLYIAKEPPADSVLARVIGRANAEALGREMGGDRPTIPVCRRFLVAWLRRRGVSVSQIARELRCHENTVYAALRAQDDRQLDLFQVGTTPLI